MGKLKSKKLGDVLVLANILVFCLLLNVISGLYFFRIDLTEEKRYTIKPQTRDMLNNLDDDVYVEVFLEGDLNPGFKRFQKSIGETLEEFRIYSDNKIHYRFVNPAQAAGQKAQNEFMQELISKGITPTNVVDSKNGERSERLIFPGAVISYGGFETGVQLLKGNKARTPEEEINQSIEGIEYELGNAIYKLVNPDRDRIGFVTGHGELDSLEVASLNNAMLEAYDVFKVNLDRAQDLSIYNTLLIAKPTKPFSEQHKFLLDQYLMKGGKLMLLIDKLGAQMDSASNENYFAFPYDLNLDDQLFKYGIRLNFDLVQDQSSGMYPVVTGVVGNKPNMQLMPWPFFPLINRYADHPITNNLDAVVTKFVGSLDTVKADGVKKTPLLFTSEYSRKLTSPVNVSVNYLRKNTRAEDFVHPFVPVGYLLEGSFTSLYKNRFIPEGNDKKTFKGESIPTKIIVIADGDIARNDVNPRNGNPQELGFDPFTQVTFANRDLLMNALAYLTNENGLIKARNKEIKIRPLDRERIKNERLKWQLINLILPLVLLLSIGLVIGIVRKRKYARF